MTPARGERRRASRGYTYDPCPGCKREEHRPKDELCLACRHELERARELLKDFERKRATGAAVPFILRERVSYYNLGPSRHGFGDRLRDAVRVLLARVTTPASDETPRKDPSKPIERRKTWSPSGREIEVDYEEWPFFLASDEGISRTYESAGERALVLADPITREAVSELDLAIRETVAEAYKAGKEDGRNILLGLASGDVTIDEFDSATLRRHR